MLEATKQSDYAAGGPRVARARRSPLRERFRDNRFSGRLRNVDTMLRFCDSDAFARRSRSYKWDDASLHGEIFFYRFCRCFDIGGYTLFPVHDRSSPTPRVPNVGISHGSRQRRARVIVTETVIRKHVASIVLPKRSSSSPLFLFFSPIFFIILRRVNSSKHRDENLLKVPAWRELADWIRRVRIERFSR